MKGDIALAGFLMTAEEWESLDSRSRAQLVAAAHRRDDGWVVSEISGAIPTGAMAPDVDDPHR